MNRLLMKKITIGRASENDIIIDNPTVSGYHAEIVIKDDGAITLTDYSRNGTSVNGVLVHNATRILQKGDPVLFPDRIPLDWSQVYSDTRKTQRFDLKEAHRCNQESPEIPIDRIPSHPANGNHQALPFGDAISSIFSHYADFSGRARRSEYWWFVLLNLVLLLIPIVNLIWMLAAFIPGLAVAVRRLHDIGKSGWFLLLGFIPFAGAIVLVIWFCQDSESKTNIYGANPKAAY